MRACPVTGPRNGGRFPYAIDPGETAPQPIRPKSLPALFAQGKHWRRSDGTWVRVKDMHPAHRANAARMLLRDAAGWAQKVSMATLSMPLDSSDDVLDALGKDWERTGNPEKWMRSTKLYRRLVKGLPRDAVVTVSGPGIAEQVMGCCGDCVERCDGRCSLCHDNPEMAAYIDRRVEVAAQVALRMALSILDDKSRAIEGATYDADDVESLIHEAARRIGVTL